MSKPAQMGRIAPRWIRFLVISVAALALTACGSTGPGMAQVSGKVTYNGNPVTKGTVSFQSTTPDGRNATGMIDPDGSYRLQTENPGDGALVGDYIVVISARDNPILDYIPKTPVAPKLLVPAKFENPATSGLKATVKSGSNPIDFPLKD
jgi:hypothetical protein